MAGEVMDPDLKLKPATCALKRALLVALRCDVSTQMLRKKKSIMGQVVGMLEAEYVVMRIKKISSWELCTGSSVCISGGHYILYCTI